MRIILFNILLLVFITTKAQEIDLSIFRELNEKVIDNTYPKIDAVIVMVIGEESSLLKLC